MASFVNSVRQSACTACRRAPRYVARRGYRASPRDAAAHNFTMPALSPTMTEGNIASWRVKEGDSYSAGDVLLEIETDKATMDVEAQDDGVLVKVMQGEGSKGVKVGQRIAVTAEPEDDIKTLEIPAEESGASAGQSAPSTPREETAGGVDKGESSPSASEAPPSSKPSTEASAGATPQEANSHGSRIHKQTYPLLPSVEHLLHENGLSSEDANIIKTSGPNGRLLKGDVLAYLGRIQKEYPAQSSARLSKLEHLDLSNIQLATAAPAAQASQPSQAAEPELPSETEIAVPISLSAVIATQKRVQDALGIFLPLSTFIARASELANEDLPLSKSRKPTADELFDSVLGLDKVAKSSRGHYIPQVTGLGPLPTITAARSTKKPDIIDMLAPKQPAKRTAVVRPGAVGVSAGENIFSVIARLGEERRAAEYLERMKLALEKEPGRLVF